MSGSYRDLSPLARHERQAIYAEILRDKKVTMTPSTVKDELEKRGMTFAFVGQDMAAMRLMPFIQIEARGQYRWKETFRGEVSLTATKRSAIKRASSAASASAAAGDGSGHAFKRPHVVNEADESDTEGGASAADDSEDSQERDRALRNLDALLAIAERESMEPEQERWVMGFRIRL